MEYYEVQGITQRGEGVVRIAGQVCFVAGAIPGERVAVELTERKRSFSRARLVEVAQASPDRITPRCPLFGVCGGCAWQHVSYPRQLQFKQQIVTEQLRRIARLTAPVSPVLGMESPWHYRNKVTWHVGLDNGQLGLGFFAPGTNRRLPWTACALLPPAMNAIGRWLNEHAAACGLRGGDQVVLRHSNADDSYLLLLYGQPQAEYLRKNLPLAAPEVSSVVALPAPPPRGNRHLTPRAATGPAAGELTAPPPRVIMGRDYQLQHLAGCHYRLAALSFLQVNHAQAEVLYRVIRQWCGSQEPLNILEAYCGAGTISCMLARDGHRVWGVENNPHAVRDAEYNAALNGLTAEQCRFTCGNCEQVLPDLTGDDAWDLIILDPPRAGCAAAVITAALAAAAPRIIYVSCDPATLARDLLTFTHSGYRVVQVQPVDMFAQTGHVECAVLMSKPRI